MDKKGLIDDDDDDDDSFEGLAFTISLFFLIINIIFHRDVCLSLSVRRKNKNFQYPRDTVSMKNIFIIKKDWWWKPSLWNYSLKQINNIYTYLYLIYVCMFVYFKQRTTSLFLFMKKLFSIKYIKYFIRILILLLFPVESV